MKLAVLGNVNMSPIGALLPDHDLDILEVGALPAALMDPASAVQSGALDGVIVHVDGDELLAAGDLEADAFLISQIEMFARSHPAVLVVLNTLRATRGSARSFAEAGLPGSTIERRAQWDLSVSRLAHENESVAVLDLPATLAALAGADVTNNNYWYLGRIKYTKAAFQLLAADYGALFDGWLHRTKKVLVLDLDNTLWGGVLGEDGIGGVALSEDGVGKCFRDLQRQIKSLASTGVLLAVASKNDEAEVVEMLEHHPQMILRPADFAAIHANWSDKVTSIRAIAHELDLGLESFVFVDDNPFERGLVEQELPAVTVADFPARPELLQDWFIAEVAKKHFPKARVEAGDAQKTDQYRSRKARQDAAEVDLGSFLDGLQVELTFHVDDEKNVGRLAQLTQKTNQFNLTTRRATPAEVLEWIRSDGYSVVACEYRDRFGDEGIIGLAVVDLGAGRLDNLLLSCRVLGRGVETPLLERCIEIASAHGLVKLDAEWIASGRNGVAKDFLGQNGFEPTQDSAEAIRGVRVFDER